LHKGEILSPVIAFRDYFRFCLEASRKGTMFVVPGGCFDAAIIREAVRLSSASLNGWATR
jgi:hypothetical protein